MVQAVEVRLAGAARQFVEAERDVVRLGGKGLLGKPEGRIAQKLGVAVQLVPGELHEQALEAVQIGLGGLVAHLELFPHLVVEVLQQLAGACCVIASLISRLSSSWSWSKAVLISSGLRQRW